MRSNFATPLKAALVFSCLVFSSLAVGAQTANVRPTRITQAVNENNLVTLRGNTHPMAQSKYDQGPAPDGLPMDRMLMVLQRGSDQELTLKAYMDGQQSKSSPSYHQWLTPEQFGQQFGVSDDDIQTVSGWLQTQGFQVNRVAAGKMIIEFSGTAGQIKEAFHTQIHKYLVNGEEHWANASDPQIPAALAPVIKGINTMNNFKKKPMIHAGKPLHLQDYSGAGTPQFTVSNCNINSSFANPIFNNTCFGLSPVDFATIYNIPSTFNSSPLNGSGQTVAVIGDSDICTGSPLPAGCVADDVVAFRNLFGLSGNNTQIYVDGVDPGLNGDELEGILDVEWVGAIAPSAKVLFVTAGDTESSAGIDLAAERVVDNNLAGVMTESFGQCEQILGNAANGFYAALYEQAAAQGITVVLAAGDSGSAACDSSNTQDIAVNGAAVSGFASTPYAVAVGGTDFDYSASGYPSTYWNTSSSGTSSAKSYIPETTWDDGCGQSQPSLGINSNCVSLTTLQKTYLFDISGGGGGQSDCAYFSGGECFAYVTPPWQVGVGVPTGGFRYIPDVSLFAAYGYVSNSFYVVCESDQVAPSPSCTGSNFAFIPVGGTSASAQAFGGIMALVNQAMTETGNSSRQGNANYALYPLFAAQTGASLNCNSSLFTPSTPLSTGCTFRDITKGTNTVYCATGTLNCNSSSQTLTQYNSNGTALTTTPAYGTTAGFDEATGLGSVNVTNLITNWVNQVASFAPTTTTLCISLTQNPAPTTCTPPTSPITFQHGTKVYVGTAVTSTAGGTLCGDVALIGSNTTFPPNNGPTAAVDHFNAVTGNSDVYSLLNSSFACTGSSQSFTTELVGGNYNISGHYAGYNDGTGKLYGVSDSPTFPVSITPEASTSILTLLQFNLVTGATSSLASGSSASYGSGLGVRVDVCSTASCNTTTPEEDGTGNIVFMDSGSTLATIPLNSEGYADFYSPLINSPGILANVTTVPALAVGTHTFSSTYAGDPSYNGSASTSATLTVTKGPTFSSITSAPTSVTANTNFTLAAFVDSESFGNNLTGMVTFFAGATSLGTASLVPTTDGNGFVAATATLTTAKISATSSITAQYSGDGNYLTSTSTGTSVSVAGSGSFTMSSTAINIANPGQTTSNTSTITVTASGGFTGSVALSCAAAPQSFNDPPTCSVSGSPITLTSTTTSGNATLTVFTTAASQLMVRPAIPYHGPNWILVSSAAAIAFAWLILLSVLSMRKRKPAMLLGSLFVIIGLVVAGCGSSSGSGTPITNPGTTAGTYTVTVTGVSGSTSASTPVSVTVQ